MEILYEDDIFPDGKYKGQQVKEVAAAHPRFLRQYQSLGKKFSISDEVMDNLSRYRQLPGMKDPLGTGSEAVD